jgi:hypothetical protein
MEFLMEKAFEVVTVLSDMLLGVNMNNDVLFF